MSNIINLESIDIIIINYNNFEITKKCVASVLNNYKTIINVIIVDNNSTDGSVEKLKECFPDIKFFRNNENLGYAYAVNRGFENSSSDIVIISNNDVIYSPESIENLIEPFYQMNRIGVVGPQQIYPNGKWQYSYGNFPGIKTAILDLFFISYFSHIINKVKWRLKIHSRELKEVEYIDGAVMAINRLAFQSVNGFDEDYFFYTEEADFCYKLKKNGWKIIFNPNSIVIHERGGSTSKIGLNSKNVEMLINSKTKFCQKHLTKLESGIFIIIEIISHFLLAKFFRILNNIFKGKISSIALRKHIFNNLYNGWKNARQ